MAVAEVPFDLVEVKLAAPSARPGTVAKADVIARLCASPLPFATVVAPAGYGKTTLLARWAEADPRPFAWVALDGRDDDAVVFLRYIAAAIHRVEPLAPEVFDALVRPGRIDLVDARPAPRERAGRARATAGARARRPARGREPVLPRRARRAVRVRPGRLADRDREQGGAGAAARPLADAGIGCTRSAWRISGSTSRRPGCCSKRRGRRARRDRARRPDRADGGLAGRSLPRGAVDAGRGAEPGECRGLHRRRPVRVRVLPPRAPVPAAGGRGAVPQAHVGARAHVRRPLRRRARDDAGRRRRSSRSSARTASSCRSTGEASGTATTTCSASCCATSSSAASRTSWPRSTRRAMAWCIANDLPEAAVRLRTGRGRDGDRRRAGRPARTDAPLRRPPGDPRGVARAGSTTTTWCGTPRSPSSAPGCAR